MTRTKQQHYVPQFYLKNFANHKEQICVYDKKSGRDFLANVHDVGGERYFYDLPTSSLSGDKSQLVEKYFQTVEGIAAPCFGGLIGDLISGAFKCISVGQRETISYYFANQAIRTKEWRKAITELTKKTIKKIADAHLRAKYPDKENFEFDIGCDEGRLHIGHIFHPKTINSIANILRQHIWLIGINCSGGSVYTSDHPLVKRANIQHPFRSMSGYASPGIEIAYPLSPKYLLCMFERTIFKKYISSDGKTIDLSSDNIDYYNYLQISESNQYVYCAKNDFGFAQKVCNEEPRHRDPDRDRVEMVS